MTRIQTSEEFKRVVYFTDADLQDNRQGFMSFRQKRMLRIKSLLNGRWLIALPIGCFFLFLVVGAVGGSFEINDAIGTVAFCLLIFFIIGFALMRWFDFHKDIRAGKVSSMDIQTDLRFPDRLRYSTLLNLKQIQLDALQGNYTYRFYFAPITHEVLSVEVVRVDKGPRDRLMPYPKED
jgi:hypothetical protein